MAEPDPFDPEDNPWLPDIPAPGQDESPTEVPPPSAGPLTAKDPTGGVDVPGPMSPGQTRAQTMGYPAGTGTRFGRESGLQQALIGRTATPTMDAASWQAAQAGGAAALGGVGMTALGGMAAGGIGAGMQAQHENTLRAIAAQRAGSRGPAGLAERGATAATGMAGAQLAGEAGKLQLQAAAQEAQLRESEAGRADAITSLQAQFQQQTNMSNAEMEQKANEINLQVESTMTMERDKLIAQYENMNLTEQQYITELEEAMARLKEQLTHDYWKADLEANTALYVTAMQEADTMYLPGKSETTPGYGPGGKLQGDYWSRSIAPPATPEEIAAAQAEADAKAKEIARVGFSTENPFGTGDRDLAEDFTGAPEVPPVDTRPATPPWQQTVQGQSADFVGPPTVREQIVQEGLDAASADQARSDMQKDVGEQLDYLGRGVGLAVGAYQIGSAKNTRERKRAALEVAKSEGVRELAGQLADKIGSKTLVGAGVKFAHDVGTAAADDSKRVDQKKRIAHVAGKSAAQSAGSYVGGAALGKLGAFTGPAAPIATPLLASAGAAGGGYLGGEAFEAVSPAPGMRTTNPQEMIGGALGGASPTVLAGDPMSIMRGQEDAANRLPFEDKYERRPRREHGSIVTTDVGDRSLEGEYGDREYSPEEFLPGDMPDGLMPPGESPQMGEPPQMEVPTSDSYSFLENLAGGAIPGGEAGSNPQALSALGDLHERLKEIEAMIGGGQGVGGI